MAAQSTLIRKMRKAQYTQSSTDDERRESLVRDVAPARGGTRRLVGVTKGSVTAARKKKPTARKVPVSYSENRNA